MTARIKFRQLGLAAALVSLSAVALASTNIDATNKYSYSENTGWMNWRDADTGASGANVGNFILSGFIWSENAGWINLGNGAPANGVDYTNQTAADFGVNIDPNGALWGYAWGENIGWILINAGQFATPAQPAYMGCDGRLHGFAWSENVGWINLSLTQSGEFVAVDTPTRPLACDMNHDGVTDGRDIQVFINLLMNGGATWRDICSGDLQSNPDDVIDAADVAAFVHCLLG